jgi:hypothetical protein
MVSRHLILTGLVISLVAACAPNEDASPGATLSPVNAGEPVFSLGVARAEAINITSDGSGGGPVVAWTEDGGVVVARLDTTAATLVGEMDVSGSADPFLHPIERPAVSVAEDGSVDIAFTSLDRGGTVYHSRLVGDQLNGPRVISGDPRPETVLVHSHRTSGGGLILAWLEDSSLTVATGSGDSMLEMDNVDDMTCDCCNPVPLTIGESLVVAYRDFQLVDGEVVRDIVAVRSSDGGETFGAPVTIADDRWFINACPFSGPSVAALDDRLVVAWMDGRQSIHPEQASSSIWVDISFDEGATFGRDIEVTGDGINHWPVLAVDVDGAIHLVWEVQGPDGGIAYATSTDQATSFTEPAMLVDTSGGLPKSPSMVIHDGLLIVTWIDGGGGRIAAWAAPGLGSAGLETPLDYDR